MDWTSNTREELFRIAAEQYLCKQLPSNWEQMSNESAMQYISENACQPYEEMTAGEIWEEIDNLARILYKVDYKAYARGHIDGCRSVASELEKEEEE